jgi:glycosyltransferase involved in cell wall biosynthesis
MKICYLATIDNPHTQRWVNYVRQLGHEVFVLCDKPYHYEPPGVKIISPQMSFATKLIAFRIFPKPYGNNAFKPLAYRREINKIKPDVVHGFEALGYGFATALSGQYPKVLTPHGNDIFYDPKHSRVARFLVTHALRKADVITTNMPNLADFLERAYRIPRSKVRAFSWGIDLDVFRRGYEDDVARVRQRLGIPDDAFIVLSNRQMQRYWGAEEIIRAIPFVVRSVENVYFIMLRGFGAPEFVRQVEQEVETFGARKNVRFIHGYISAREMAIFLNLAHAFVSVPFSDLLSLCVLEGMACGSIPILSDLEAYKTRIRDGENGFFVPAGSPEAIAEKILYCASHPELRSQFAARNRAIVEELDDWRRNAPLMLQIYESLL